MKVVMSKRLKKALKQMPELVRRAENGDRRAEKILLFGQRYGRKVESGEFARQ